MGTGHRENSWYHPVGNGLGNSKVWQGLWQNTDCHLQVVAAILLSLIAVTWECKSNVRNLEARNLNFVVRYLDLATTFKNLQAEQKA